MASPEYLDPCACGSRPGPFFYRGSLVPHYPDGRSLERRGVVRLGRLLRACRRRLGADFKYRRAGRRLQQWQAEEPIWTAHKRELWPAVDDTQPWSPRRRLDEQRLQAKTDQRD